MPTTVLAGYNNARMLSTHWPHPAHQFAHCHLFVSRYSAVRSTHISQKIEVLQRHSDEMWKFEMWGLTNECDHSPLMPAPFNIPENVYMIIRWVIDYRHHHSDLRRLDVDNALKSNIDRIKNSQSGAVVDSHLLKNVQKCR